MTSNSACLTETIICDKHVISQATTALCAHRCVLWEMCADVKAAGQSETIIILKLCTVAYTFIHIHSSHDTWSLTNVRESPLK